MPELPEVEVVRRSLAPRLRGRRVLEVVVREPRLRERVDAEALATAARGRTVVDVSRRAKYLLIAFDAPSRVAVHLGMSGRLTLVPDERPTERHEHVQLHLDGGERLRFVDPRRFGLVAPVAAGPLEDDPHFAHLGLEPLETGFDGAALAAAARGRRGPVKPFLMDASVVVGVGNIYASEALFRAGVSPRRSVARIAARTWDRIAGAVRDTLAEAIALGGTTLADFVDGAGREGGNRAALCVYDREGEPCVVCGAPVRRRVMAGRSTYHCGRCQR